MPVPSVLNARGKQKKNLSKGGHKPVAKTPQQKADAIEVRALSRLMLSDPAYLLNLKERLQTGKIQPGVEAMLWYYAFGKPPETLEQRIVIPVRIQHEYTEEK